MVEKYLRFLRISSRYAKPYLAPRRDARLRSRRNIRHSAEVEEEHKTLDRGRGGTVVLSTTVEQNLSTAVKGAAFAYDD
ncbi:hypothetical protein E3N88_41064 [Mikania micrantha]|uniref:Uncharacterized protein n=1 Tax=Mikania micrantha TaxID=192012 RepID=A0A5N6LPH2_9ASTR|nr:hypothetical protein E3N88_41064 [Mikania micrantha]